MTNPSPQLINIPTRRSGYCEVKPEPDLSIVRGTNPDYRDGHPRTALLVVEVAVSSGTSDREMVKAYAGAGVPECWLVAAERKEIECYPEPTAGAYAKCRWFGPGDEMHSETLPNLRVPMQRIFGRA